MALGFGAIFLFAVGLARGDAYDHLFFTILGVILLILFAFFSRISGALGFGKFQIPIVGEQQQRTPDRPKPEIHPERDPEHRPSLAEVKNAASKPTTQRSQSR